MRHRGNAVVLAVGAAAAMGIAAVAVAAVASPDASPPRVIALKFHADWCGSCRAMGTAFTDLGGKYDGEPVLFVQLDLTNRTTRAQAEYMAAALGLGKVWAEHGSKTGFILLIDARKKTVLAKLEKDMDLKAMGSALLEAVKKAS